MIAENEHHQLVKKMILSNRRYKGNEDLLEDFCSETMKRTYSIIPLLKDEYKINSYVAKVSNSSIIKVLKDSGRLQRRSGFTTANFVPPVYSEPPAAVMPQVHEEAPVVMEEHSEEFIEQFADSSVDLQQEQINRETLENIATNLHIINSKDPGKQYYLLFKMRYIENMKQKDIADKLYISQGEVSKRLIELSEKLKSAYKS